MAKEELTLSFDDGEFIILGVIGGAMKVVVDTKGTGEGGCGDGAIVEVYIAWD